MTSGASTKENGLKMRRSVRIVCCTKSMAKGSTNLDPAEKQVRPHRCSYATAGGFVAVCASAKKEVRKVTEGRAATKSLPIVPNHRVPLPPQRDAFCYTVQRTVEDEDWIVASRSATSMDAVRDKISRDFAIDAGYDALLARLIHATPRLHRRRFYRRNRFSE
jgi:hypothetical protein